jgi:REP element-mobilizing transposase RayT
MSAYRQILYHLVFRTKYSAKAINQAHASELYKYIWGIIKNKKCMLFRINGMEDHIHILSDLHPSIALADYVKDIKVASSKWVKESGLFPNFKGWGIKYCALTYSYKEREHVINYIKNQQEHHKKESFQDEVRRILKEHGINVDEKWFWQDE